MTPRIVLLPQQRQPRSTNSKRYHKDELQLDDENNKSCTKPITNSQSTTSTTSEGLSYEQRLENAKAIAQSFILNAAATAVTSSNNNVNSCYTHYYHTYEYKSVIDVPWYQRKLQLARLKNWEYIQNMDANVIRCMIQVQQQQQQQNSISSSLSSSSSQYLHNNNNNNNEEECLLRDRMFGTSGIGSHVRTGTTDSTNSSQRQQSSSNDNNDVDTNQARNNKRKKRRHHHYNSVYIEGMNLGMNMNTNTNDTTTAATCSAAIIKYVESLFIPWGDVVSNGTQLLFPNNTYDTTATATATACIVPYRTEQGMCNAIQHMNGATLEDGSVIRVTRAIISSSSTNDSRYATTDNDITINYNYDNSNNDEKKDDMDKKKEKEERLDDFFSSLL